MVHPRRRGLDYGPSIYRIETDDVTGELPNNAEMVGFMCFVEAYDGAGGFGEYDIWFRPTEGDIVVCEENDPAIIGRFSSLQNLRDEIEVPATLDVWFEDRCNGKHGEWYPAPR